MTTMFLTGIAAGITLTYLSKPVFRAMGRSARRFTAKVFAGAYAKEEARRAHNRNVLFAELEKPVYEK